ncbi:MAG TPA: flagellar biosynthesis protein FlhB [bacterium]|nr:flagellar biosynthesis protein FlhB [bacterium]
MAEASAQERTEAPTQKKREDARKEGQVALSREVASAALLGSGLLYFIVLGRTGLLQMEAYWVHSFQKLQLPQDLTISVLDAQLREGLWVIALMLLGLFAVLFAVSIASTLVQVGIQVNPFNFQASRINPLSGLKRIFSANGLAELMKGLFKMGVIGYITWVSLNGEIEPLMSLSKVSLPGILAFNFGLLAKLFGRVAVALAILAVFDYLFQRWQYEQQLKMTKQELKEELKQTEGDPQLRSRVRQIQRELSRARMMQNVPKADVVVTNPTHFAIALEYDREVMSAPKVTAKGADFMAERIKAIARENDVPIVENPLVAREIYNRVEIGEEVPEQFFRTVAEILAYVYRLKSGTATPAS